MGRYASSPERTSRRPIPRSWLRRSGPLGVALLAVAFLAVSCGSSGSAKPSTATTGSAVASTGSSAYQKALKYASCMRTHGFPNFPDPNSAGKFMINGANGINPVSSQYQDAHKACEKFLPNGGQVSPGQSQKLTNASLQFAQCMRSHGITNFPDPTSKGSGSPVLISPGSGVDTNSPQYQRAMSACQSILQKAAGGSGS